MSLTADTITPDATSCLPPPYIGLLRNSNPSGNPNAAPRCGAKNRAGTPCRAPAMPNGRCRCHGGKSTGPRTEEGKARSATANTKHGNTTAPCRIRQRYIRTLITRSRVKCQARLLWPYLPREMFNRLAEGPEELWTPIHPSNLPFVQTSSSPPEAADRRHPTQPGAPSRPLPRALAAERAAARAEAASQAPWRAAIAYARANKREWLAFRRADRTEKRAARAAKRAARAHAASLAANPETLLPPPETAWTDYTPLEKELAARLAGLRAHPSEPRPQPTPSRNSSIPRIDPMNPEPGAVPAQNPESTHLRINPVNPEPGAPQGTPARAITTHQHRHLPILSRPPARQDRIADHHPGPACASDGQNPPTSPAAAPPPNSTLPRINPINPEPAAAPAQNPDSAHPRINPTNPEPPKRRVPTRLTPTKAAALRTTTLSEIWQPTLHAVLVAHLTHPTRQPTLPIPPASPPPPATTTRSNTATATPHVARGNPTP